MRLQEHNRSFSFNQKYPNLLDEDARTPRTQVDKLMSFPALTPTRSNSDKDRCEAPPSSSSSSSKGKRKSSSLSSITDSKSNT
jgi:hypothetical protein